jgi:hypothetical protein
MRKAVPFFCTIVALPVGLSKASWCPDFSQKTTYFMALQCVSDGPLMLIIIRRFLMGQTVSRLGTIVFYRFIWLKPRSEAANNMGRIFNVCSSVGLWVMNLRRSGRSLRSRSKARSRGQKKKLGVQPPTK